MGSALEAALRKMFKKYVKGKNKLLLTNKHVEVGSKMEISCLKINRVVKGLLLSILKRYKKFWKILVKVFENLPLNFIVTKNNPQPLLQVGFSLQMLLRNSSRFNAGVKRKKNANICRLARLS